MIATTYATLHNVVTLRELLNALLNQDMDATFMISMQESKTFPIDVDGYHYLAVNGNTIWHSQKMGGYVYPNQNHTYNPAAVRPLNKLTTVRELILHLAQFNPDDSILLNGHFYTGLYIAVVKPLRNNHYHYALTEKIVNI